MTMQAENGGGRRGASWWRVLPWVGASALLAAPAVAMRLGADVDWTAFDFIVAGVMLAVPLTVFELALRTSGSLAYRAGAVVALGTAFLITWSNLAVGIIGSENDPINLMFFGVIFIAIAGSFLASFRARGLAIAMTVTAVPQPSGIPWMRRYSTAFFANQESNTALIARWSCSAGSCGNGVPVRSATTSW